VTESRGASLPPVPAPAGGGRQTRGQAEPFGTREKNRIGRRKQKGGQQRSWDFLGCLNGLLNSKERLHMFQKCVSIWDARELAQKQ